MELGSEGAPGVGADGSARRELELLGGRGGDLCVREAFGWRTRARGDTRAGQTVGSERRGCLGPRGRGCDLWECEELGGKDASARATGRGCMASRSARKREPDRKVGAGCVLGSERERCGALSQRERRGVCAERGARASS